MKQKTMKKASTKKQVFKTPIRVGNTVLIRAVALYYTGVIITLTKEEVVLKDAAWIASTGRFAAACKSGKLDEVEPYPDDVLVSVNRGAILDVADWNHPAPRMVQ